MFSDHLQDTFDVERLVHSGDQSSWSTHLTSIKGMFQPLSDKAITQLGIESTGFKLFCNRGVDIQQKDRVVFGGIKYEIELVKDFTFGNTPHLEIILSQTS